MNQSAHLDTSDENQLQGTARERIIRKIKRCLALSQSSNPTEAETALRQAQSMMQQYRLTEMDVHAEEVSAAERDTGLLRIPKWQVNMAAVAAKAFGCKNLVTRFNGFRSVRFTFIGVAPAGELAAYAYDSLMAQCAAARSKYIKEVRGYSSSTRKLADDFCLGWTWAVHQKINDFAKVNQTSDHSRALMVIAERDKAAIDSWVQRNIGKVGNAKPSRNQNTDPLAIRAGLVEGQKAEIRQGLNTRSGEAQLALAAPC